MDTLTQEERSERMSRVKAKDTKPEMAVRSLVHRLGFRYRLHDHNLPGTPDLVFTRTMRLVFVHGCFWHRHKGCALARMPKTRVAFWKRKLEGNRKRDSRNQNKLRKEGWRLLVIWDCQLKDVAAVTRTVKRFLGRTRSRGLGAQVKSTRR